MEVASTIPFEAVRGKRREVSVRLRVGRELSWGQEESYSIQLFTVISVFFELHGMLRPTEAAYTSTTRGRVAPRSSQDCRLAEQPAQA